MAYRKPRRKAHTKEKEQVPFKSPQLGSLWIRDVDSKATYYPKSMKRFRSVLERLKSEQKQVITSIEL